MCVEREVLNKCKSAKGLHPDTILASVRGIKSRFHCWIAEFLNVSLFIALANLPGIYTDVSSDK